ncbi:MAG: tetratricopeptide repeat protein [Cyanobium sp. CZS 48M]|nr:tetratricopeptide repeat protein [Cyanobium sp. CZS48M]
MTTTTPFSVPQQVVRLQAQHREAEALPLLQQLLSQDPQNHTFRSSQASLLLRLGQTDQALALLAEAEQAKSSVGLLMGLGACARAQGDRAGAFSRYGLVLELDPSHRGAQAALVLLAFPTPAERLEEKLQKAMAAQAFEEALALSSCLRALANAQPWTVLRHANLLRLLGRPHDALEVLKAPVADPALQAHVLKNRGEILRELGDLSASLAVLQEAVRLDPTCPDHAIALGFLHADLGAFDQGLELLHEAERLISDPDAPAQRWLRLLQVFVLHRRGEYDTALAIAQGLTGDADLGFEARVQVAALQIRLGDAKAEAALETLSPAGPRQEGELLRLRLEWLFSQFRFAEVLQLLEPALAAEPLDIALADQACLLQVLLLDLDAARQLYSRLRQAKQASGDRTMQRASRAGLHRGIYEEFNTNREVAGTIRQLAEQPPAHRLEPLAQLLAKECESNAAAFSLLLAARQAGRLQAWSGSATDTDVAASPIPRRVMQLWLGDDLPESLLVTAGSWQQANPGYEHVLFRADSAAAFIAEQAPPKVCNAYLKAASPLLRSDLFRLAYLSLNGGVAASLNVRCRHSLDAWLSNGIDVVLYQQNNGFLGTDFLASTPDQPLLEAMLDLACFLVLGEQGSNPWFLTGPGMLTLCFARYYREGLADLQAPPPPGMRLLSEAQLTQRISADLQWPVRISEGRWSDPSVQFTGRQELFQRRRRGPRRR